jgi:two-component system phosphate regulon sensor histidine kinase PhoR
VALFWRRSPSQSSAAPDESTSVPRQAVLDAMPDAAGVLQQGHFVAANGAMEQLFGAGRVLGRSVLETTRSKELADAVESGPFDQEFQLPALQRLVLARARPLPAECCLLLLRDLTDAKRLEGMRRDFIANASHELRTPVAALKGAAETLLGLPLDADAKSFVHIVSRHAERLARLTQYLLDLSRLETGQFRPAPEAIELDSFVEGVLELFADKPVPVGADIPPGLRARADRRALEQVLVNLLDNAVKHTPPGGRVTVLADDVGGAVEISVLDTGPGIEERHRDRIFERFYRADSGRARDSGGTGLGLAIVKHLAQAQGGTVGVQSGRGGSRFWVRLPSSSSFPVVTGPSQDAPYNKRP